MLSHAILLGAPLQPDGQIQPATIQPASTPPNAQTAGHPKAAALASACAYRNQWRAPAGLLAACNLLADEGWALRNHYQATTVYHDTIEGTVSDVANADIYTKNDDCMLAFQGADAEIYLGITPSYHMYQGQDNVTMMTAEMESLLREMGKEHGGLGKCFSPCKSLIVVGHSMGATQAALFAWAANKDGDPRGMGQHVSELYLFAPTPISNEVQLTNDQMTDGCFPGAAYFTAVPPSVSSLSDYLIDYNVVMGGFAGTPSGYESLGLLPGWLMPNLNAQHIKTSWQMINLTWSGPVLSTTTQCGNGYPTSFSSMLSSKRLINASVKGWLEAPHYLHSMDFSYAPAFS
jgi:hypothetical protein